MAQVNGICDEQFQSVRDAFAKHILSGEENGASLCVNFDGRNVVDLNGGYSDNARTKPWSNDTIVNMYSCTKIITALAALKLADDGLISLADKVAKYWPEFAANGKENVEIRHLLSHSSGVAGWEKPMTYQDMCDVPKATAALAAQAPFWEPGTMSTYHCWVYGHLIGEVVLRVTGLSLREFVAKELAIPAGADVQIGCREEDWARTSEMIPPPAFDFPPMAADALPAKILNPIPIPEFAQTETWRRSEIGAANGHGNAAACVKLLSNVTLAGRGAESQVISKETADSIFEEQTRGVDMYSGMNIRWGNGLALRGEGDTALDSWLPPGRVALWGGWGGSLCILDFERKITISYVMNKMRLETPVTPLAKEYLTEIYRSVGVEL